jgi:hypothetical protein
VLAHVEEQIIGDLPGAIDFVLSLVVGLLGAFGKRVRALQVHRQLVLERCDPARVDASRFVIPPVAPPATHLNTPTVKSFKMRATASATGFGEARWDSVCVELKDCGWRTRQDSNLRPFAPEANALSS